MLGAALTCPAFAVRARSREQSSFDKAKQKPPRKLGTDVGAWTKGGPRFAKEPDLDKITPSAVHYTPNFAQCSRV